MGESFPMKEGDGAYSYTKNSQLQKEWSDSVKDMIQDALINKLDAEISSTTVRIVDFGCSVGPNTFFTVQNLIQALQNKFSNTINNLEFQVLFNDHSSNDFNTLFASLPPDRQYHAAGVPGSFHGRLFPRGSITVAQSSYALQWLSKQPGGVPNEGRIYYSGAPEDVGRAYSDQFERDSGDFMSARAEEIVSGGLMFLLMPGTPDQHGDRSPHSDIRFLFDFFGSSLMDLVDQGVVEKSLVDGFNLPVYFPKVGEMRKVIEKNGSCFSIERMELIHSRSQVEESTNVASLMKHMRAGLEGVFASHFGNSVVDKMFDNVSAKAEEISRFLEGGSYRKTTQLFVVLKRK